MIYLTRIGMLVFDINFNEFALGFRINWDWLSIEIDLAFMTFVYQYRYDSSWFEEEEGDENV